MRSGRRAPMGDRMPRIDAFVPLAEASMPTGRRPAEGSTCSRFPDPPRLLPLPALRRGSRWPMVDDDEEPYLPG